YATNSSGSWAYETVDIDAAVGTFTSIVIDSSDNVHIAYYDATNTALKYATNSSGSWACETVDSSGTVGTYASIDLDSSDTVHICYYDGSNTALKYATTGTSSSTASGTEKGTRAVFGCFISTITGGCRNWPTP
ncbi:MAG: hypothetical protein JRI36_09205, partial [Deltaproteobacteria bacterium]|nr:hypothetical protein [Deltaproteobacteria bacterium]